METSKYSQASRTALAELPVRCSSTARIAGRPVLSVAPLLAEIIRRLHAGNTLSDLWFSESIFEPHRIRISGKIADALIKLSKQADRRLAEQELAYA